MMPDGLQGACQIRIEANGPQTSGCTSADPRNIHKLAQEFESLLIEQVLKSVKLGDSGEDGNSASGSMMDFAKQNLAQLISHSGGIGMAHFLENALNLAGSATPGSTVPSPATPGLAAPGPATPGPATPGSVAPGVTGTTQAGTLVPAAIVHALIAR
jgi:hypothetical protein